MSTRYQNVYKTCRKLAGLSQEQAAPVLGVEVRQLSNYENGHAKVPDDVVGRMAKLYKTEHLPIQHLKSTNELARKFLPDVFPTHTHSDAAMQTIMATRDGQKAEEAIIAALEDGELCEADLPLLIDFVKHSKAAIGKRLSAKIYVTQWINTLLGNEHGFDPAKWGES
ncbi:MAG: helix-turn-helix transcriptional regulator [Oscillospiraceae bacterium]|nr:helix-turn-helix transcriptional regulator [Oscillospiraceae bacterium]